MPTYEFKCDECEHVFELLLSMSTMDGPLTQPCPKCAVSGKIQRLMGAPPIGDPVRLGLRKPKPEFQDRLKQIAKAHQSRSCPTTTGRIQGGNKTYI